MVSIAVSKIGMTELIFVVRPWNESQRPVLLRCFTLSADAASDQACFASDTFVFQQDNAASHRARTPLNSYSKKRRTSLVLISGHKIAQIWIQWIIKSGVLCSRECMIVIWTLPVSWSCASLTYGTVCSRTLLTRPSTSGESNWEHACMLMDNILNIYCERELWTNKIQVTQNDTPLLLNFWFLGS